MSFQELSEKLQEKDEEKVSRDIDALVNAGIVSIRFHHHHVMYALAQQKLKHPIHALYQLEHGEA